MFLCPSPIESVSVDLQVMGQGLAWAAFQSKSGVVHKIENFDPHEMEKWHKKMLIESGFYTEQNERLEFDTISVFFASSAVKLGDGEYTTEKDLKKHYKDWMLANNYKFDMKDWSVDHMSNIYDKNYCERVTDTHIYPKGSGKITTCLFVNGVSIISEDDSCEDGRVDECH